MNSLLLQADVQDFIHSFNGDSTKLAFKGSPFDGVAIQELLQQIDGYKKAKDKLPSYHATQRIYYPPKLHIEQSSSETTAKYKASLVKGKTLIDITGGLGVDCLFFSEHFETVYHIEQNEQLSKLAAHNFKHLGKQNIKCIASDGITSIGANNYDVIYVDPARRDDVKGKVFFLRDCFPNVITHFDELVSHSNTLLIKTSPMLDISAGLAELKFVKEIHVVAVENDVKELLWVLQKTKVSETIVLRSVNITKEKQEVFSFELDTPSETTYGTPKKYLYEPNAAIMKSGGYSHISNRLGLEKLHRHSHLFTSDEIKPFPGRSFRVEQVISYQKKEMRTRLTMNSANITIRNFPETVAQLRKKWKIKDGGNYYLFFTTQLNNEKIVLVCRKL
ncbi:MAG: class I SAM-dependent methyltransferase [Bacteroidetes bacterium]|nr:class I SAM-dependent methyltransferase [Bacteroidota bacterium]